jgi:peptidoglycan hydrolase CwlO-like protein
MSSDIVRNQTPEELELQRKQAELASLEAELIQRELDLATLRADLRDFESRYLATVGVLYAELDEIEAQIAEAEARRMPSDSKAQEQATRARAQAEESAQTARPAAEPGPKPTEILKKLFREVAKCIHPDLATNDADRARRQKLMAEANVAYENGDEAKLRSILTDWKTSPDTVEGRGVGAELIRAIRKIAQIQKRLSNIEAETQQLHTSDLYQLRAKTDEAEKHRQDLLREMASQVEQQIEAAKERFASVESSRTHE